MIFTPPLIAVLPPEVHAKVRRLDADPANTGLMAAAALHLDVTGATFRHTAKDMVLRQVRAAVPPHVRDDHAAGVTEVRQQLDELAGEWRATKAAPMTADDMRAGFTDVVDRIAAAGTPAVLQTKVWPVEAETILPGYLEHIGRGTDAEVAAFLVWMARDHITARLSELIDRAPRDGAISDADRDNRFRDIAARRLALERIEEACIEAAFSAGIVVPRRPDADPRAVMEIDAA